jgi:hypothetical protein
LGAALGDDRAREWRGAALGVRAGERAADGLDESVGRLLDLRALVAPGVGDSLEHGREPAHLVAVLGWEIGPAVERPAIGGQEHR